MNFEWIHWIFLHFALFLFSFLFINLFTTLERKYFLSENRYIGWGKKYDYRIYNRIHKCVCIGEIVINCNKLRFQANQLRRINKNVETIPILKNFVINVLTPARPLILRSCKHLHFLQEASLPSRLFSYFLSPFHFKFISHPWVYLQLKPIHPKCFFSLHSVLVSRNAPTINLNLIINTHKHTYSIDRKF